MTGKARRRFQNTGDWHSFLIEAKKDGLEFQPTKLRQECYRDIEGLRKRPLLVYAVQFPGASKGAATSIDLNDVDGFVDLIEAVPDDATEVDVLIHSPGGMPEATERIVDLLRGRFTKVGFLIPHSAYSAATMLALSGDEVIMHPAASLGPIDPQLNGIPARSIRRGFERVRDLLKKEGPEAIPAYLPLIEKQSLEILELCEDAELLSRELACEWLSDYMFADMEDGDEKEALVDEIVDFFASYDDHKTHGRPLTYRKLSALKDRGLKIVLAEGELRSLLREAHVLLTGFLGGTDFVKLYENGHSLSWGRKFETRPLMEEQDSGSDDG